jgi:hypothetical protein
VENRVDSEDFQETQAKGGCRKSDSVDDSEYRVRRVGGEQSQPMRCRLISVNRPPEKILTKFGKCILIPVNSTSSQKYKVTDDNLIHPGEIAL